MWDAAVILCGGRSTRMGSEKALLDAGGKSLIERHLLALAPRFCEVAVSVAAPGASPELVRAVAAAGAAAGQSFAMIPDRWRDRGPLAGVATALAALEAPRAFFVAVDIPEARFDLVAELWARAALPGARGCVPRWASGLEPAHAVYGRSLLGDLERLLEVGTPGLKAIAALTGVEILQIEEPSEPMGNLNTFDEYRRWRERFDPGPRETFR
jgi:molybdopterin-guanine dinucleotide biosynthesis protein A